MVPGALFKLKAYGVKGELSNLLRNYLHQRNQRVVLNGQTSSWELIKSGVPQGTSLFSHVYNKYKSQSALNIDLQVISNWIFQWKIQFNPDLNKRANLPRNALLRIL